MKKEFRRRACNFALVNYRKIESHKIKKAGLTMDNARCHWNAVAAKNAGRADKVWLVLAGSNGDVCVHFINSKDGMFFDETWHEHSRGWDYYIIRQVREDEFGEIGDLLNNTKEMLFDVLATPLERLLLSHKKHGLI